MLSLLGLSPRHGSVCHTKFQHGTAQQPLYLLKESKQKLLQWISQPIIEESCPPKHFFDIVSIYLASSGAKYCEKG